jgi:hypothetical protein
MRIASKMTRSFRKMLMLIAVFFLPLGVHCFGAMQETFGTEPQNHTNYSDWMGIVSLWHHPSRVYHTWVNGNEHFYYRGGTDGLNEALLIFSKMPEKQLEVVLRPGPASTKSIQGDKTIEYDWKMQVVGGISAGLTRRDKGNLVWSECPMLHVHIGGGNIDLDKLSIPPAIQILELNDLERRYIEALASSDKTVRGWGAGKLARLNPYSTENAAIIARLLDDPEDWVRLCAIGALATYGHLAKPYVSRLKNLEVSDESRSKKSIEKSLERNIKAIENSKEKAEQVKEHRKLQEKIGKYVKSLSNPNAGEGVNNNDHATLIRGKITNEQGAPVTHALIEWGEIDDLPKERTPTQTDSNGEYEIDITEYGVGYRLGVSADEYAPVWYDYYAPWTSLLYRSQDFKIPPPQEKNFVLRPSHSIEGVVVDEDGQPIENASIKAGTAVTGIRSSFSEPSWVTMIPGKGLYETRTDAQGYFQLSGLPEKSVNLNITSPFRHINDSKYGVDEFHRIIMRWSGRNGHIRARVVDKKTSKPVQNFTVTRRYNPESYYIYDSKGHFEFEDDKIVEERGYPICIYAGNYLPWSGSVCAIALDSEERHIIELQPSESLSGMVIDNNTGNPLEGVQILYGVACQARYFDWGDWDNYVDGHHSLKYVQRAESGQDGRFMFCEDRTEQGTLFIRHPGYGRAVIQPRDRFAKTASDVVEVALSPEVRIGGTLFQNGKPLQGSKLQLDRDEPYENIEEWLERITSDPDGDFSFGSLKPGRYTLSLSIPLSRWHSTSKVIQEFDLSSGESIYFVPIETTWINAIVQNK